MAEQSPAAKVLAAFNERHELCGPFDDDWAELCIAAAIEMLADQVVPHTAARTDRAANRRKIRAEILGIASKLKGIS